jgi:hypothetical protein
VLKNPLSFVALTVKRIPNGTITMAAIQEPKKAEIELSSAKFFPKVFPKN